MTHALSVVTHKGDGPPLLLVHGMLASRSQWLPNLPAFSRFASPITIELYGHHLSPAPGDAASYAPDNYVRTFEALREKLGIERWFVGGCSLGAALTMRYALCHPDRVYGQFLTNSSSAFANSRMVEAWQSSNIASYERLLAGGMAAVNRIPVHPRHAKRFPEAVKQALVEDSESHDVRGIASTVRWTSPFASVRSELRRLQVPTLLLCGSYERRFKPLREFVAAEVPQITIRDLPAGHAVNMEAADAFNRHIESFVSETLKTQVHAG